MNNVTLSMTDELTGKSVDRTIDITNAMTNGPECWELRGKEDQRTALENWISERGNKQHDALLSLNSWVLA